MEIITRSDARILHQEIDEALRVVATKHGLNYQSGTLRFLSDQAGMRVQFFTSKATMPAQAPQAHGTQHDQWKLGDKVKLSWQVRGATYEVIGFKRVNVVIKNVDTGTRYRAKPGALVRAE